MKKRLKQTLALGTAGLYCMLSPSSTLADTTETVAMVKSTQIHEQAMAEPAPPPPGKDGIKLNDFIKLNGLIEADAIAASDYTGTDTSSFELATVELALEAKANDWASGLIVVDYESDDDDRLFVDEANITLGKTDTFPLFLTAGKVYAPFGHFATNMIQDPLTHTLGEINVPGVIGGFETYGITGTLLAYKGMNETGDDDTIKDFGAELSYAYEQDETSLETGISWVSNIVDAEGTVDVLDTAGIDTITSRSGGLSLHLSATYGAFSLIGEYTTALDNFDPDQLAFGDGGAKPAAVNGELAYTTELLARETVFAAGYQQTSEALALELPEERFIASAAMTIFTGTTLSLEYYLDRDYSTADGGTGEDGSTFTTRLAYEF